MRKHFLTVMTAVLLLTAAPTFAGRGEQGDWEFGPYGGGARLDAYGPLQPDDESLYGARLGYFFSPRWSYETSLQKLSDSETEFSGIQLDIESLRLNVLYNFRPGQAVRPFVTAGFGYEKTKIEQVGTAKDAGYNLGAGLRWFVTDHFGIRLDGRSVWTNVGSSLDENVRNTEGTLGLLWAFGGGPAPDEDGDGVPDRKDKCPGTPRGAVVDDTGCPKDSDGDGVFDGLDRCPDTPKGWPVDDQGCPLDSDGDGVKDGEDACPGTPRGAKVDARGCHSDSDGDGVADGLDRCPETPRGAKADASGCPIDSDGDGVWDGLDRCPDTPRGEKVDESGCPLPKPKAAPLFEAEKKTLVLEGVTFESDEATLLPGSMVVLDRVAVSLADWPEVRVEIGGHTDSTNTDAHNLALSQRRAEAVRDYLIHKGTDGSRLTARGYGEKSPIADNTSKEGRAKNRRVELTKID